MAKLSSDGICRMVAAWMRWARAAKPKAFKSEALGPIHEIVEGLGEAGVIDKRTLRKFDNICLVPVPYQRSVVQPMRTLP